ncbi:hypothetical protein WDZ92_45275, partial [Nostoc sp. NIES-2111]
MKSASLYTVQAAKLLRIRRRRHRAQETLWVRHRVPVAIEQPSDTEFPLAIRTTSPRRSEYRSYRGRIFAPDRVLGMRSAPEFPIEFITNAFEGRLPASSWQNPFLALAGAKDLTTIPEESTVEADVAEVLHDGSQDCVTEVARIATGYLIFNGYLWKETRE